MADSSNPWLPDWQAIQQQMFSTWTEAARNSGMGTPGAAAVPEGFDAWTRLMGAGAGGHPTMDKVMGSARQFTDFMQGMIGQLAMNRPEMVTPATMREGLEKAFGAFSKGNNPLRAALDGINAEGARGFEELNREFMKSAQPMLDEAKKLLSLPTFGLQREQQERQQSLVKAVADYSDKSSRFQALIYKASRVGLEKFESKLEERAEPGRQVTTLRGLYDVFVDAAEEGYAEVALSDDFREAYGEMVNAQMRLRQRVQGEVERSTADLGMPSRTELNTVHERMHQMRRRLIDLEERLEASERRNGATAPAPAAPAARAPRKKAASTKAPGVVADPGNSPAVELEEAPKVDKIPELPRAATKRKRK